jgi:hypothetical protein
MLKYSSWETLNTADFIDVAHVLLSKLDDFSGKTKLMFILSGLSDKEFIQIHPNKLVKHFNELDFLQTIIFEKSFLPTLDIRTRTYQGPKDRLDNFNYDQFVLADIYFFQLQQEWSNEKLDAFISILYPPTRKAFEKENCEQFFHHWEAVPEKIKRAAFLNFFGLRAFFKELYPLAFAEGGGESSSALHPYDRLADELAGPKFGTKKEVGKNNVHDIFIHIQNLEEKRLEAEANKKQPDMDA